MQAGRQTDRLTDRQTKMYRKQLNFFKVKSLIFPSLGIESAPSAEKEKFDDCPTVDEETIGSDSVRMYS
jgi:hypothetical protein